MAESPLSTFEEATRLRALILARKKEKDSGGYRAGIAWSLAAAFPMSECGSFTGLLKAIDEAEQRGRKLAGS